MSDLKQWVNLEKENLHVTDGIPSELRLGAVKLKATFKNADLACAKLRLVAEGNDNVEYNDAEAARNSNFKKLPIALPLQLNDTKKGEVEFDGEFELPAAGGNKYKFEALYKDKSVATSKVIESIRRLYFQVISMKSGSIPSSFSKFQDEFEKYFIEMKEKEDGRNKLKFRKTVHQDNEKRFLTEARKAYTNKNYNPYSVAVVFSNMIAEYEENENKDHTDISVSSKLFDFFGAKETEIIVNLKDAFGDDTYVWKDLDDDHDKQDKFWLISAKFITENGTPFDISPTKVNLHGSKDFDFGGYNQVKVTLDEADMKNFFTRKKGSLILKTRVVEGFSGGYSMGSKNFITIAARAWWRTAPNSDAKMIQILNHEMGHKIGMVATGDRPPPADPSNYSFIDTKTPDSPPHLYGEYYEGPEANNKGHQGPHCENGVNYDASKNRWSGTPACVMFGATGMTDTTTKTFRRTPAAFCSDCGKVARKLDVDGSNLKGFRNQF